MPFGFYDAQLTGRPCFMQSPASYRRSAKISAPTDQNCWNMRNPLHAVEDFVAIAQKAVIGPVVGDKRCESEPSYLVETAIDWSPVGVERNMCRFPLVSISCSL